MIEIEDEHFDNWADFSQDQPESWAELTDDSYNNINTQAGTERGSENVESQFEDGFQPVTDTTRLKQRQRDFDFRRRINRNRGGGFGGNRPRNRDSFSRDSWSDRDPWNKDSWNDDSFNCDSWNRDLYRPRPAQWLRCASPLRSPVNINKRFSIRDMDNSFRFTNHRRGNTSLSGGERYFHNNAQFSGDYTDRPRRRLHLPPPDDGYADETSERLQEPVTEEDKMRMARKEKDISYGKNTEDYQTYIETIPVYKRSRNRQLHPRTPDKFLNCSRRSWDAQVKIWKIRLHAWADQYKKDIKNRNEGSKKSLHSEGAGDAKHAKKLGTKKEIVALSEDEHGDDDDYSFLDTVNLHDYCEAEKYD